MQYTAYGKYKIRLYDKVRNEWVIIAVDDWIPVKRGTNKPLFAQPNADEAWVLLLEKAVAKFMVSSGRAEVWSVKGSFMESGMESGCFFMSSHGVACCCLVVAVMA